MATQTVNLRTSRPAKPLSNHPVFTHKATVKYDDINDSTFTTDGDLVEVQLLDTPDRFLMTNAMMDVKTAFATDGTLTGQFGTDGDPNNFVADTDVKTAGPIAPVAGANILTVAGSSGTSSDVITLTFTTQAATGAPADITAGEVDVYFTLLDLAEL